MPVEKTVHILIFMERNAGAGVCAKDVCAKHICAKHIYAKHASGRWQGFLGAWDVTLSHKL